VKFDKAIGLDDMYPVFRKNYDPKLIEWFSDFFSYIFRLGKLSKLQTNQRTGNFETGEARDRR